MKLSLIIPSYNNLQHLKNAYASIKKHAPNEEICFADDCSTDGTWEWLTEISKSDNLVKIYRNKGDRLGHTILYDTLIELASNDVISIFHADMIMGPNYVENILKHLEPGVVVSATRIEPPLHPAGKEKIIYDFGQDFDDLNISEFEEFVLKLQQENQNIITNGIFAPWAMYKSDFQEIGGHDPLFAPFPYEDSDIFNRMLLNGFKLIQSWDAFVYHLTCRGHRWTEQIQRDDDFYKQSRDKSARNYVRKWGSWIRNDEYQHPIIPPKYDIGFVVRNCNESLLAALEPWCSDIYVDCNFAGYVLNEQKNTSIDLLKRVHDFYDTKQRYHEILVEFDASRLSEADSQIIYNLAEIIQDSGELGDFIIGNLKITINSLSEHQNKLIKL